MPKYISLHCLRCISVLLFICILFSSCNKKNNKTVLILGNSIVKHPPNPNIGWNGNWGMAASVIDSDFVHRLIRDIKQKDSSAIIIYKNIGDFERSFPSYSLSVLDSLKNVDILIMKIAENVNDKKAVDSNFIFYYDRLLNYIDPDKKAIKIIVDGFWKNSTVNSELKEYAARNNYTLVSITDLSEDITNTANNYFANKEVASHPSDKGMRLIEERIWQATMPFFLK